MGFLSNMKAQIEAAQAAGNAMAGAAPVSDIPEFIDPRPQDEVDRLLKGTGTIRAIVLGKRHQVLEQGERIGAMRVQVRLRPRGPEGTLGDEVTVKATLSTQVASLVTPGLDIPVERDAKTGAITKVASKQLTEELAGRMDEANRNNPGWGLDPAVEGMIETAGALGKALKGGGSTPAEQPSSMSDPRRQPIDRITWETYVAVCADLALHGAPQGEDAVAQKHGVKAYTWLAISSAWKGRIAADPELTAMFERDLAFAAGPGIHRLISGELAPEAAIASGQVEVLRGRGELLGRFARTFRLAA